jgi:thioredoxin-related protein
MPCLRRTFLFLFTLALLSAGAPSAWGGDVDWQTDVTTAWKQAREQERPLLVFITTSNCRYCTMMQNVSFADPDVVEVIERGFVPTAVDAKDVSWLVRDQKVSSYPTTLIISPAAEVVDRIKGYVKPEELKPRLARTAAPTRTASKQPAEKK